MKMMLWNDTGLFGSLNLKKFLFKLQHGGPVLLQTFINNINVINKMKLFFNFFNSSKNFTRHQLLSFIKIIYSYDFTFVLQKNLQRNYFEIQFRKSILIIK